MKNYTLLLFIALIAFSYKKYDINGHEIKDYDELQKTKMLLGKWQTVMEDGNLQEIWTTKNDSTFLGQSYFISNNDTIHNETIDLVENAGKLLYISSVKGENQNLPTTFNFIEGEDNQLQFENPKHDYPNKIIYKFQDSINLDISIFGNQLGKKTSENFKMFKIK